MQGRGVISLSPACQSQTKGHLRCRHPLTRDIQDCNDDQQPGGRGCTPTGVTMGKSKGIWGDSEAIMDEREVDPRRESRWEYG